MMIALFFLATTVPLCWVSWRLAYQRGRSDQKAMRDALARFDERSDPFYDAHEAARKERAAQRTAELHAAFGLGLDPAPKRDGISAQRARDLGLPRLDIPRIDLRDQQGRWN